MRLAIRTERPEGTMTVGRLLGERLAPGDVIALRGELGAGKTVFVKGLAQGLGADPTQVTSPTFVLITEYPGRLTLYHIDAYRLTNADDLEALGVEEILYSEGVCAVEWADRVAEALPADRLEVEFEVLGSDRRQLTLQGNPPRWQGLIRELSLALDAQGGTDYTLRCSRTAP